MHYAAISLIIRTSNNPTVNANQMQELIIKNKNDGVLQFIRLIVHGVTLKKAGTTVMQIESETGT